MPGAHGTGCGCRHEDDFVAISQHLLPWIDVDNVVGLNEEEAGSAKRVFRPYDNRLDDAQFVESTEGDEELLILVPFTAPVKVTGLTVIGGDGATSPSRVRLYINRPDIDFASVYDVEHTQELDIVEDFHGAVMHPLRAARFISVTHLAIFFPTSIGGDRTRIHWIGLWGVGSEYKRQAVITVYEAVANPSEKQVKDEAMGSNHVA